MALLIVGIVTNGWLAKLSISGEERKGRDAVRGGAEGVAADVGPRREVERLFVPQVQRQSLCRRSGRGGPGKGSERGRG